METTTTDTRSQVSAHEVGRIIGPASANPSLFQPGNTASLGHGPPLGNTNGFKSGRASRRRLTIGALPKGCSWINTLTSSFRRELERCVCDVHGEVSYAHALLIQSAARHEQAALLAQRWLRLSAAAMSHGERLSYIQAIAAESDKRDKAIERLKLDRDPQTIVQGLYGPILPAEQG